MKCPIYGTQWLPDELDSIGDCGCPGCRRVFDIGELEDGHFFSPDEVADWFIVKHNENK